MRRYAYLFMYNYLIIHAVHVQKSENFCFLSQTRYDIIIKSKKKGNSYMIDWKKYAILARQTAAEGAVLFKK